MGAQLQLLDDAGMGLKPAPMSSADFWLEDNLTFRHNRWTFSATTANATPTALTPKNADLAANSAYAFEGLVVARYDAASTAAGYRVQGCVKKGAANANTALVGTPLVTAYEDTAGMDLGVTADTTNGRIILTGTGVASTTIYWNAALWWLKV